MEFISNIDKNEYEEFVSKHKKSHFLQSYEWGQFCKRAKNRIFRNGRTRKKLAFFFVCAFFKTIEQYKSSAPF